MKNESADLNQNETLNRDDVLNLDEALDPGEILDDLETRLWQGEPVAQVRAESEKLPLDSALDRDLKRHTYFMVNQPSRAWPEYNLGEPPSQQFVDYAIVDFMDVRADTVSLPVEPQAEVEGCSLCADSVVLAEGWIQALKDGGWQPSNTEYLKAVAEDRVAEFENSWPYTWHIGDKIPVETLKSSSLGRTSAVDAWLTGI